MKSLAPRPMTVDEFILWAMEQPEGERYELVGGEVVAMSPERATHARVKMRAARVLQDALAARGLPCEAFPDGMTVEIDESTAYEPDALVRCGDRLPGNTVKLNDPLIVVEVLSPRTRARDTGGKLADYFRLASLRHYLILDTERRTAIHHRRDEEGRIETRILRDGTLALDPPGLELDIEALFADVA